MKKSFVYIMAAIVAVAIIFVLVTFLVNPTAKTPQQTTTAAEPVAATPKPIESTTVVVVNQEIPAGTSITADMLATKSVLATEKPLFAVDNAYDAIGMLAVATIPSDTILTTSMIEKDSVYIADGKGLSYELAEGFVGLAIPASGLNGVAGYLQPGDVVNILADAKAVSAAMNGTVYVASSITPPSEAYLVKNVTIVAVGNKAYDEAAARGQLGNSSESKTASDEESEETSTNVTYDCIVVALDDFSAQLVAEVMKLSPLTLTLRYRPTEKHDITVPELEPTPRDFLYITEEDVRDLMIGSIKEQTSADQNGAS